MPGASLKRHKLNQLTITPNQQVRGNLHSFNLPEIGMGCAIKTIREERFNIGPTELARWQADSMDDDEFRLASLRTLILIGRRALCRRANQSGSWADCIFDGIG